VKIVIAARSPLLHANGITGFHVLDCGFWILKRCRTAFACLLISDQWSSIIALACRRLTVNNMMLTAP